MPGTYRARHFQPKAPRRSRMSGQKRLVYCSLLYSIYFVFWCKKRSRNAFDISLANDEGRV